MFGLERSLEVNCKSKYMATFRTCVQKQRKDGFYPVYIHVTHLKKSMWFVNMNYDI